MIFFSNVRANVANNSFRHHLTARASYVASPLSSVRCATGLFQSCTPRPSAPVSKQEPHSYLGPSPCFKPTPFFHDVAIAAC